MLAAAVIAHLREHEGEEGEGEGEDKGEDKGEEECAGKGEGEGEGEDSKPFGLGSDGLDTYPRDLELDRLVLRRVVL